ncbi:hypothetical protein MPH_06253 [Macrophomina phaseolina MS6]|uniref:Uncharacterized protein n=1 Tax=Macrophomina phaseolina (strain MS6) TaxID=1126212 RepID=K2RUU5_MACPH|nr:hypothetical protein MPH_06253 [Macrophomina phaseolina MS6]
MEQITPDLSTAYHALLTEIQTPQKIFAEPMWSPLESNYLDDSDSSSVSSDETVVGGFDPTFLRPSPPPPSPNMDQRTHWSQNPHTLPKIPDTPATSPLFVVLDMLDIMLEQAEGSEDEAKSTSTNEECYVLEKDLETSCDQVEERLQLFRSHSQSGPSARRRHHRLRPSRRSAPSLAPQIVHQPDPDSGLSPAQLMQMIDILMTRWPLVESAVLSILHQNPGANIRKYVHMLGKVLLDRVSGSAQA